MRFSALCVLAFGGAVLFGIGCKKEEAPAPPAAGDPNSTGVAECDGYLKEMVDCYKGTPQEKQIMDSTNALREKLKGDIQAKGKDTVKGECVQHSELLKKNPACAKK